MSGPLHPDSPRALGASANANVEGDPSQRPLFSDDLPPLRTTTDTTCTSSSSASVLSPPPPYWEPTQLSSPSQHANHPLRSSYSDSAYAGRSAPRAQRYRRDSYSTGDDEDPVGDDDDGGEGGYGEITMQDNEASGSLDDRNRGCWARSVEVTDWVVVHGGLGSGSFVVWSVRVETLQDTQMTIRKRYSEFDRLRQNLRTAFPRYRKAVPPLPPKSFLGDFRPRFLEKRRAGLQYFLK